MFKLLVLLVVVTVVWGLPNGGRFPLKKPERSIPDGRIAGGHNANIADYPYQLALTHNGSHWCGASMLGSKWALTAASCTYGTSVDQLFVIAGTEDLTGGQVVQAAAVYRHPQFDYYALDYDVAVLELAEDIATENATPIALHDAGYVAEEGTEVTVSGWGYLAENGPAPDVLQVLVTKVINNDVCNENYADLVTDRMVCSGNWEEGGEASCNRDEGGPLVVDGKQYGIASWGWGCAQPHYPSVNARVTEQSIREFIKNITGL